MKKKKIIIIACVILSLGGWLYIRKSKAEMAVKDIRVKVEGSPFAQADFKLGQYVVVSPKEATSTSVNFSLGTKINYFVQNYGENYNVKWFQSDSEMQSFDKRKLKNSQNMWVRKVDHSNIIVSENLHNNEAVITHQGTYLNILNVLGEDYPLQHIVLSYSLDGNKEFTIMLRSDDQPIDKIYDVMLTDADGTLLKKMSLGDFVLENFETSIDDLIKSLELYQIEDVDKLVAIMRGIKTDGRHLYFYNLSNQTIYRVDANLEKRQTLGFEATTEAAVELTYVPSSNQFLVEKKADSDSSFYVLTPDLELTTFEEVTELTGYFAYDSTMFVSSVLERGVKYVNFSDKKVAKGQHPSFGIVPVFSAQGDLYFEDYIENEEAVREGYAQLGIHLVDKDFSGSESEAETDSENEIDRSSATIFVRIDKDKLADFFALMQLVE